MSFHTRPIPTNEPPKFEEGDIVRFVESHHSMKPHLIERVGELAVVSSVNHGQRNRVLVGFLDRDPREDIGVWKINPDRLELVERPE